MNRIIFSVISLFTVYFLSVSAMEVQASHSPLHITFGTTAPEPTGQPSTTPTPVVSVTPKPTAAVSPAPSETPEPTNKPEVSTSPSPSPAPSINPTVTPEPTSEPSPTPLIAVNEDDKRGGEGGLGALINGLMDNRADKRMETTVMRETIEEEDDEEEPVKRIMSLPVAELFNTNLKELYADNKIDAVRKSNLINLSILLMIAGILLLTPEILRTKILINFQKKLGIYTKPAAYSKANYAEIKSSGGNGYVGGTNINRSPEGFSYKL